MELENLGSELEELLPFTDGFNPPPVYKRGWSNYDDRPCLHDQFDKSYRIRGEEPPMIRMISCPCPKCSSTC